MYGSPTFVTSPATVRIMAAAAKSDDKLKLGNNMAIQKLLSQIGDNFPEDEKVVLSAKLIKNNTNMLWFCPLSGNDNGITWSFEKTFESNL